MRPRQKPIRQSGSDFSGTLLGSNSELFAINPLSEPLDLLYL
jgi:hypothetical protein